MRSPLPAILPLLLAGCLGCSRPAPVPKPDAFPRVELYADDYRAVGCGNVSLLINSATEVSSDRPGWLTVTYPRYGALIYFTVSHHPESPEEYARAVDNRRERISLNLGDAPTDVDAIDAGGFHTYLVKAPDVRQMPLQMLAADGRSTVVSAAVYFPGANPASPADSLAPLVDAIYRDLLRAANSLSYDK